MSDTSTSGDKVVTVVIRASEWLRGAGKDEGELREKESGRMCCLGIDAAQRGVPAELLNGIGMPADLKTQEGAVEQYKKDWQKPAYDDDGDYSLADIAARINDDDTTNDETKIAELRPVFALAGREIDWRPNE